MKVIGGYEFGDTIGTGGFSKVKKAVEISTGKTFAVKCIKISSINDPVSQKQIEREISILRTVHHPNIAQLHQVIHAPDKIYLVLEFVSGGDLFDLIANNGPLPEVRARKYFHQLIDALDYMHQKRAIHRDLKPENILISENDDIKITDFGLSIETAHSSQYLQTCCGTPNYVAPEIFKGESYQGGPVDIWGAGLLLYVMLSAYPPFNGNDINEISALVIRGHLYFPRGFPRAARDLINKIIVVDPKRRLTLNEIREDPWFNVDYQMMKISDEGKYLIPDITVDETGEVETASITGFELISQIVNLDFKYCLTGKTPSKNYIFSCLADDAVIHTRIFLAMQGEDAKVDVRNSSEIKISINKDGKNIAFKISLIKVVGNIFIVSFLNIKGDEDTFKLVFNMLKEKVQLE